MNGTQLDFNRHNLSKNSKHESLLEHFFDSTSIQENCEPVKMWKRTYIFIFSLLIKSNKIFIYAGELSTYATCLVTKWLLTKWLLTKWLLTKWLFTKWLLANWLLTKWLLSNGLSTQKRVDQFTVNREDLITVD